LFAQWVIYFDWKKKFAGLGGVKGGSHEYILHITLHHEINTVEKIFAIATV
jgi:hypothetical protein